MLPRTFEEALKSSQQILNQAEFLVRRNTIETESEQLVIGAFRKATGRGRTFSRNDLYVRVLDAYPTEAGQLLLEYCKRRISSEPLQYILGYQTFLNHEYEIKKGVLIPRPETEVLVYEITQFYKRQIQQPECALEVGVGSGCISIELLKIFPALKMIGSEVSLVALELAESNALKILGDAIRFKIIKATDKNMVLDVFSKEFNSRVDFIVSNPPYLFQESELDEDVLKHEPHDALFAPKEDALYFYRKIIQEAPQFLKLKGSLFFECPHERIEDILDLFDKRFWKPRVIQDLTGRQRFIHAEWLLAHWS